MAQMQLHEMTIAGMVIETTGRTSQRVWLARGLA